MDAEWIGAVRPALTEVGRAARFEWRRSWQFRRARTALALCLLPILVAIAGIALQKAGIVVTRGADALGQVVATLFLQILVLLPLVFGTSLVVQEAEARTLVYLLLRPLSRGSLLLGKFLGAWLAAGAQLCAALVVVTVLLLASDGFAEAGPWIRWAPSIAVALVLGCLAYGALFTLVGLVFSRPALVGLFLAFGWESAIPFLPGWIKSLTIRYHLAALLPADALPPGVVSLLSPPGALSGTLWLLGGAAIALLAAMALFARRDFP